jgi:hypothetical protein
MEEALAQLSVQSSSILHQVPSRDAAEKKHLRYAGPFVSFRERDDRF